MIRTIPGAPEWRITDRLEALALEKLSKAVGRSKFAGLQAELESNGFCILRDGVDRDTEQTKKIIWFLCKEFGYQTAKVTTGIVMRKRPQEAGA